MRKQSGFTVIEVLVVLTFVVAGAVVFYTQQANVMASLRDKERKVAANSIYYSLEEYYYPDKGYYPEAIDSATLRTVDPELFTDPEGNSIDSPDSNYRYESRECDSNNHCKQYTLTAYLEEEDDYVKTSRRE